MPIDANVGMIVRSMAPIVLAGGATLLATKLYDVRTKKRGKEIVGYKGYPVRRASLYYYIIVTTSDGKLAEQAALKPKALRAEGLKPLTVSQLATSLETPLPKAGMPVSAPRPSVGTKLRRIENQYNMMRPRKWRNRRAF